MNRIKFSEKIIIECEVVDVFDYSQDYGQRLDWDTFLKRADILNGAKQANKGVKTYCQAKNGIGMETVYITYNRPKATAIKMTKGPFMFKSFLGSWTFNELENKATEVIFLYSFQLRFPFNLMSEMITTNLKRNVKQRLKDLKLNIEQKNE